jgi:hypothetical protein
MIDPATAQSTDVATGAKLGPVAAIWNVLLWREVDFHPLVVEGGTLSTLDTSPVLQEMEKGSAGWSRLEDNEALKRAIDLAKQSLADRRSPSTITRGFAIRRSC